MIPIESAVFGGGNSMAASRRVLPGAGLMLGIIFGGLPGIGSGGGRAPRRLQRGIDGHVRGFGLGTVTSTLPASLPGTCTANFALGTQVTLTSTTGPAIRLTAGAARAVGPRDDGHADRGGEDDGTFVATAHSSITYFHDAGESGPRPLLWRHAGVPGGHGFPISPSTDCPSSTTLTAFRHQSGCNPALSEPFPPNDRHTSVNSPPWLHFTCFLSVENPTLPGTSPRGLEHTVGSLERRPWIDGCAPRGMMLGGFRTQRHHGIRAMGYYDGTDLPYYYFMASNFGTSDRWYSPAMTPPPNRMYLIAATSAGRAYPCPPLSCPTGPFSSPE